MPTPANFLDLTGKRFHRLLVIERAPNRSGRVAWSCICDCGNTKDIVSINLVHEKTKSCGCLRDERTVKSNTKHGNASRNKKLPSSYNVWRNMHQRCNNPNNHSHKWYGGRGINVCHRWSTFQNFYSDMGDRPKNRSLDRIDNNGNYEPSNCRWATYHEQRVNSRPKGSCF